MKAKIDIITFSADDIEKKLRSNVIGHNSTTNQAYSISDLRINRPLGAASSPELISFAINFGAGVAAGVIANWIFSIIREPKKLYLSISINGVPVDSHDQLAIELDRSQNDISLRQDETSKNSEYRQD